MSKILLDIDNEMIKETVKAEVASAIAGSMGGIESVTKQLIKFALETKVDSTGKVSNYSSDNKHQFLDILVINQIKGIALELIEEYFKEQRDTIKKELKKQLSSKTMQNNLAEAMVKSLSETISCKYKHSVEVKFQEKSY